MPYNGLDDDCNVETLDDDLDQDGFVLDEDCDDNNANIYPGNDEVPYNGLDDDCNAETLDDDLDQDGFVLEEDCDDTNANIYPGANEIPNNGIDEDCDGMDGVVSSTSLIEESSINMYPNPVTDFLYIETKQKVEVKIWTQNGVLILSKIYSSGIHQLESKDLHRGLYFIQFINEHQNRRESLLVN